jgi:hypothetical protein
MTISKKDQIAYWSSEAFLSLYFYQLKFNEPYSKAKGSIAGGWVRSPWHGRMREIVFRFVKDYAKKHHHLPKGEHSFNVNWYAPNAKWLKEVLLKKQVVTFPKIEGGYLE